MLHAKLHLFLVWISFFLIPFESYGVDKISIAEILGLQSNGEVSSEDKYAIDITSDILERLKDNTNFIQFLSSVNSILETKNDYIMAYEIHLGDENPYEFPFSVSVISKNNRNCHIASAQTFLAAESVAKSRDFFMSLDINDSDGQCNLWFEEINNSLKFPLTKKDLVSTEVQFIGIKSRIDGHETNNFYKSIIIESDTQLKDYISDKIFGKSDSQK